MAYVGPYWKNKPDHSSPINAANLEIMDEGITQNDKRITELHQSLEYSNKMISNPTFDIDFSSYETIQLTINSNNNWVTGSATANNSILIAINGVEYITFTGGENGSLYAFLTDSDNIINGQSAHLVAGTRRYTVANGSVKQVKVPSGARYVYLLKQDGNSNNRLPSRMTINNNIFNSLLSGNLTNVNLDSGVTYATSGNPGDVVDLTQIARSGYYSKVMDCQEGDAFVITGSSTSVNAARLYCFINSNNQIIQVAESSVIASALLLKVPENTAKAVFNFNGDCSAYYIKGYSISDVYRIWEKQNNGEMVWFPNPMVTYLDNTIYSTQYPRRAHSLLFKAVVPTKLQFDGIPDENRMYIYYCSALNQSISGTRRIDVVNGVEYTIAPGYYYRALLQDDGTNPAWEVDSITIKKNGSGTAPTPPPVETDYYDLILFAGQSNMAGRGITSEEHPETYPDADDGVGYEFRAISSPNTLYEIAEPFGLNENKTGGLNDGSNKTGGSVVSFANSYYKYGGVPIIAVSASEGATDLQEWLAGYSSNTGRLYDACQRLQSAVNYCSMNDIKIRHKFVVWLQGETDAVNIDNQLYTITDYVNYWEQIQTAFKAYGAEKLLVIRIGKRGGPGGADTGNTMYDNIIEKQTELCQTDEDLVMICTDMAGMRARGYMKDQSHYYQVAYNEFGTYAGINAAIFANQGKEPTMYDPFYDNLYYSKKN